MTLLARWWRFNAGGLYGFLLQLLLLTLLSRKLPLPWAVAIAVEAAVVHNFVWHELFTWSERHVRGGRGLGVRLLRFQITNGLISLLGNVTITAYLRSNCKMPTVVANLVAIGVCSVFNFAASEWLVFKKEPKRDPEEGKMLFV